MEGSKMKCGEGVKEGQLENTGEGGWCCSTNKYGAVSPTSNYLCTIIILYCSFIVISLLRIGLVTISIVIPQVFFIQRFFKTSPLPVDCLCCSIP